MKNLLLLFCMITGAIACTNTNTETAAGTADSISPQTVDTPVLEDPDTTDTIPASAYPANASSKATADLIRKSLVDSILKADLASMDSSARKFVFSEIDLNADGQNEIFVGFTGSYFCGSGGCTIMLLDSKGQVITQFTVSEYPVIVDNNKTNGWSDLIINSNGNNHLMKFDGKKYPSNPSVQPVFKMTPGDSLPRVLDWLNFPYPWFRF
jgi:hypothetical protein